jgi:cyclopropane-fatty-acyl-phospholipid synthase
MKSRIWTGSVFHERFEKVRHRFEYPLFFYAVDLDELDELARRTPGLGRNRVALTAIHDADYLDRGPGSLREKLDRLFEAKGVKQEIRRVELLTCPRYFNHVFNPVSFYFGYGAGDQMRCVVMEVSNTFDERHIYFLDDLKPSSAEGEVSAAAQKAFHVSPFFDRSGEYQCRFRFREKELEIGINLVKDGQPAMVTWMKGSLRPLTGKNLFATLLKFPFSVILTLPRIHWQALKLYFGKKLNHYKKPPPESPMTIRVARPKMKHCVAMRVLLPGLKRIRKGRLELRMPDGQVLFFGDDRSGFTAAVHVRHYDFFWRILKNAGIGLGEGYMARDWESPDPVAFLNLLILNQEEIKKTAPALGFLGGLANRFYHLLRANTVFRSRENIREHYDLSNDFFKLFLDPSMMYSCAFFKDENQSLEEAQMNKIARLIEKARIRPGDHVLEIGCGWGGFAIEAVKRTGCRVTGITLSKEQLAMAEERVRKLGLQDKIEFRLCDYRNMEGRYDRIVSIEMLEAVGHEYLGAYFKACDRLLKPDGFGVFQVITIPDQRYENYRRGCDFIQKHIFPGGHLPSLGALCGSMAHSSSLLMEWVDNIGDHYALTLKKWREAFLQNRDRAAALGFDPAFIRKWDYYFIYCESAFRMRHIQNLQFAVTRAGNLAGHEIKGV